MNPAQIEDTLKLVLVSWIVIIAASILFGRLCKRIGQPLAVGEIAAGLLLGPSFLGLFAPELVTTLFPPEVKGPLALLATVVESFQWLPTGGDIGGFLSSRSPVQLGGEIFALGLSLALPFMAMLLFVNVALGVVSRVAPQLNLFGVGFPVTITVGIAMLTVGLPMIEAPLAVQLDRILAHLGR